MILVTFDTRGYLRRLVTIFVLSFLVGFVASELIIRPFIDSSEPVEMERGNVEQ